MRVAKQLFHHPGALAHLRNLHHEGHSVADDAIRADSLCDVVSMNCC